MTDGSRPPESRLGSSALGIAGERVRARDPALFFASLFAAPGQREAMWLVHAVHGELLRALGTSQPLIGAMRIEWWREVAEGAERRHELATPLSEALAAGSVQRDAVLLLCDAADEAVEQEKPAVLWRALGETFGLVLGVEAPVRERLGALWESLGTGAVPAATRWPRAALPAALPAAAKRSRMPRVAILVGVVRRCA